jgi:hypothetical protein
MGDWIEVLVIGCYQFAADPPRESDAEAISERHTVDRSDAPRLLPERGIHLLSQFDAA